MGEALPGGGRNTSAVDKDGGTAPLVATCADKGRQRRLLWHACARMRMGEALQGDVGNTSAVISGGKRGCTPVVVAAAAGGAALPVVRHVAAVEWGSTDGRGWVVDVVRGEVPGQTLEMRRLGATRGDGGGGGGRGGPDGEPRVLRSTSTSGKATVVERHDTTHSYPPLGMAFNFLSSRLFWFLFLIPRVSVVVLPRLLVLSVFLVVDVVDARRHGATATTNRWTARPPRRLGSAARY